MTKSESRECLRLQALKDHLDVGTLARAYSTLIRAAMSEKSKAEIRTYASEVPGVLTHPEFTV